MPELAFTIEGAEVDCYAASPYIDFALRIDHRDPGVSIRNVMLNCQVRIEARHRRYDDGEQSRLVELFGEPDRWSRTLHDLLWAHASVQVPAFESTTVARLPVACSFDQRRSDEVLPWARRRRSAAAVPLFRHGVPR